MRRITMIGLAGALGVAGTLVFTAPSWASDNWFDFPHDHGPDFNRVVACEDGYYSVTGKKDSDDDDGEYSVHRGDYRKHDDCWVVRN